MTDWKNTKCGTCVHQRKKPICNSCLRFQFYRPMTNAEKIRAMSDEELAEFIDNGVPDCSNVCPDFRAGCSWNCQHHQGRDLLLKWLQSEAEGE